jgi:hypothetical protein
MQISINLTGILESRRFSQLHYSAISVHDQNSHSWATMDRLFLFCASTALGFYMSKILQQGILG